MRRESSRFRDNQFISQKELSRGRAALAYTSKAGAGEAKIANRGHRNAHDVKML